MELNNLVQNLYFWFFDHGIRIILILGGTIIFNKSFPSFLKGIFKNGIENNINSEEKKKRAKTIIDMLDDVVIVVVWFIAALMILSELNIDTTPLLASLGAFSVGFGLALKGIANDFIRGFFIVLEDQYRIGDKIKIAGLQGVVKDLNPRTTVLKTEDGKLHIIPNRNVGVISKEK